MKVNLGTITVSDETRRAIRARVGKSGLATREEVRNEAHALLIGDFQAMAGEGDD